MVSIMPGIENLAPERTETSSGSRGWPRVFPMACSSRSSAAFCCASNPGGGVWSWARRKLGLRLLEHGFVHSGVQHHTLRRQLHLGLAREQTLFAVGPWNPLHRPVVAVDPPRREGRAPACRGLDRLHPPLVHGDQAMSR